MRRIFLLTTFLFLSLSATAKPYKKALVFSAGGFSTVTYGAILEALRYKGWVPDVIVANCGASVAAANYLSFNSLEEHQRYLLSEKHHQRLYGVDLRYKNVNRLMDKIQEYPQDVLPDIFTDSFMLINQDISLDKGITAFPTSGTRLVVTAGKLLFNLEDVGMPRMGRKTIQETFFTDPETAQHLQGFVAPIYRYWPDSGYQPIVNVRSDVNVFTAVRSSITDPFLMEPGLIGNDQYASSDAFPVEVAHHLADEVIAIYPENGSPLRTQQIYFSADGRRTKISTTLFPASSFGTPAITTTFSSSCVAEGAPICAGIQV